MKGLVGFTCVILLGDYLHSAAAFVEIPGCPSLNTLMSKAEHNETLPPCFCDNATEEADAPIMINCLIDPIFADLTAALNSVKKSGKRLESVNVEYMTFNDTIGIPDHYFKQFNFTPTAVTIVGCKSERLPLNGTFAGLEKSLKNLTIIGCNLMSVPQGISDLTSLERLTLQNTFIPIINKDDFRGLRSVKFIDLSGNQMYYVEEGAFDDFVNVETAIFGPDNALNSSVLEELNKLASVQTLILTNNNIEEIPDDGLSALRNLRTLDLTHNNIENITEGTFAGLTNLTTLVLTQNMLERIEDGSFKDQRNLVDLSIDANYVEEIWPDTFHGLDSLETLTLDNNDFYIIDKGTFSAMPRLKTLNLRKLENLQFLHLDAFGGLKDLQLLNLSLTNITTVDPDLLKPIGIKMETLDLSSSNLLYLTDEAFHFGANIQNLSLANTPLSGLPDGVFSYLTHIRYLDLSNVQWLCDDQIGWLVKWLKEQRSKKNLTLVNPNETTCWEPLELRSTQLLDLDTSILKPYVPPSEIEQPSTTSTPAWTAPPLGDNNSTFNSSDFGPAPNVSNDQAAATTKAPAFGDPLRVNTASNDESRKVKIIIAVVASVISAATIAIIIIVVLVMRKGRRKRKEEENQRAANQNELQQREENEMTTTQINDSGGAVKNGSVHQQAPNGHAGSQDPQDRKNDSDSQQTSDAV